MTYQYKAKKPYQIIFIVMLCIGIALTLGKWYSVFQHDFVILNAEVHSHLSNFSLSMIAYLGIGYSWLLSGMKFRFVTALGALLIAGNFVCETLMGFMNTTDLMDAISGTLGVLVVYVYLFFANKYGLEQKSPGKG